ncbi:hypothetical protein [Butyrivibrio sp. FCS014]|uniref:hypothetical protein n=1 Tax=Butyrivibrio sp. FCS014 TaxID=1408304 RepID=UPI0004646878|nr:hypothetical protein [Butyrivibrio sp. FCS014]
MNADQKKDAYYESSTVIFPLQINKKGEDLWNNMEELNDGIKEALSSFTMDREFTWKRIVDDNDKALKNSNHHAIARSNAFENKLNLESYDEAFTPEVVDALYSSNNTVLHYIAQCGETTAIDRNVLGIAKVGNRLRILPCSGKEEILFEVRKIRLAATIFGTCLMILELHQNNSEKNIDINEDYWDIGAICESLGVIKSNKKMRVLYPTKCHSYMAGLVWRNDITTPLMEFGRTSIRKTVPLCSREMMNKDIERFFGKTFECFWIGILQKTVAMYISSWAGSKKVSNREFNSVYEAYVTFDNQVNFLEVSFNAEIQQEYEAIKGNMSIEDTVEKLIRQIDALHSINLNKQDEKRNIILAFITVLSLVTGCMQVTESFGPTPNIAANIIAGAASLIIGLVLFFCFVK